MKHCFDNCPCPSTTPGAGDLDLLQVARLICRKFRPLDTDMESARGLENQNGGCSEPYCTLTHAEKEIPGAILNYLFVAIYFKYN